MGLQRSEVIPQPLLTLIGSCPIGLKEAEEGLGERAVCYLRAQTRGPWVVARPGPLQMLYE